jgi:8-oxo-dGTP pyrophosphatase MutT (NUDIX family)
VHNRRVTIPAPRPSATVVLLRDGDAGLELYMQRRAAPIPNGGLWVFPGGRIDPGDADPALDASWTGPSPAVWAGRLDATVDEARGAVAAACRETLEEAGVLLADRPLAPGRVAAARSALLAGQALGEVLTALGAGVDTGLLRYWAYWVTPVGEPRRYATRSFLAALPEGVGVAPHKAEADQERWLTPAAAAADQAMEMLPPTRCTVRELAAFPTVAAALAAAVDRPAGPILPVIEGDDVILPWGERMPRPLNRRYT